MLFGPTIRAFGMSPSRFKVKLPMNSAGGHQTDPQPHLILIAGCPGTGKSTFAMSVALEQGILKCVSTDTVRATMRSFISKEISPALHRSSYAPAFEGDCPVRSWKETSSVLSQSVEALVVDAMRRGTSLVLEGVHVVPNNDLIRTWEDSTGGTAMGVLLRIKNEDKHKKQLRERGLITGATDEEEKKIAAFDRIRAIQEELMNLAKEHDWLQIEQRTAPDPLDLVESAEAKDEDTSYDTTNRDDDGCLAHDIFPPKADTSNHGKIHASSFVRPFKLIKSLDDS